MREINILYAIQATGNGHLARARDVIPLLEQKGNVDILVSGTQSELSLPKPARYHLDGLSFVFGKDGGIDYRQTFFQTVLPQARLRMVQELFRIPIHQYDWILNDFEPITAWRARFSGVPAFQLSHQAAFLSSATPRSVPGSPLIELVFRYAAPSNDHFGLHYQKYDDTILTPIIRREIRDLVPKDDGHYTVYLPSYSSEYLIPLFRKFPHIEWHIFSKHDRSSYQKENVIVRPVNEKQFLQSLAACSGLVTGAGFQATSESLFLGKKLLAVPQRSQYEQQCNAVALERLGVPVIREFSEASLKKLEDWLVYSAPLKISFPDHIEHTVAEIAARMEKRINKPRDPAGPEADQLITAVESEESKGRLAA